MLLFISLINQKIQRKYSLNNLRHIQPLNPKKKSAFFIIEMYTIGLIVVSLLVQIPTEPIFKEFDLTLTEALGVLFIFGFGFWIGHTWNDVRFKEQKRKLILKLLSLSLIHI